MGDARSEMGAHALDDPAGRSGGPKTRAAGAAKKAAPTPDRKLQVAHAAPSPAANSGPRKTQVRPQAPMPAMPDGQQIGDVLGGTYRIERHIASGGMGSVFEVVHTRLQQHFALKVMDRAFSANREAYARFRQEAEIAASLAHKAIVQVFDFNTDDHGNPYMVMELVEGDTLDKWIETRGRLGEREILGVFEPLCMALDAAHNAGIVHRDLKPSNVMVKETPEGGFEVKLLDFGISKIKHEGGDQNMTRDNVVMGTPNYMSPEQALGANKNVDARTDVFALGAILYEALTGRMAFEAEGLPQLLHAIVYDEPKPLSRMVRGLPQEVIEIVETCLKKKPEERIQGAKELLKRLKAALAKKPEPVTTPVVAAAPKRKGASPVLAIAWMTSLAVGMGGTAMLMSNAVVAPPVPEVAQTAATPAAKAENKTRYSDELATPGARIAEIGTQLYRADGTGVSYWSDPGAEPRARALASAADVTVVQVSGDAKEVLVGQADGTVTRFDREVRDQLGKVGVGNKPIEALASASGYLAVANGKTTTLLGLVGGNVLKTFEARDPVSLLITRGNDPLLLIVRAHEIEVVDADRRASLGSIAIGGTIVRAKLGAESPTGPAELMLDFHQGDWTVRRTYSLVRSALGQKPRLELVGHEKL